MTIENGNVVVIRDGDTVRSVLYRKFYEDLDSLVADIKNFISEKELAEPNISLMEIVDSRFTILSDENEDFRLEFFEILSKLKFEGYCMCEHCDKPLFVWLGGDYRAYCHGCREFFA
ncbi:MAG: hypothetical protein R3Y65_08435 [Bacillota bacterium]